MISIKKKKSLMTFTKKKKKANWNRLIRRLIQIKSGKENAEFETF